MNNWKQTDDYINTSHGKEVKMTRYKTVMTSTSLRLAINIKPNSTLLWQGTLLALVFGGGAWFMLSLLDNVSFIIKICISLGAFSLIEISGFLSVLLEKEKVVTIEVPFEVDLNNNSLSLYDGKESYKLDDIMHLELLRANSFKSRESERSACSAPGEQLLLVLRDENSNEVKKIGTLWTMYDAWGISRFSSKVAKITGKKLIKIRGISYSKAAAG